MNQYLEITALDPIVSRDSRPFGPNLRMRGLPWLLPSVIAGSVRTSLVKSNPGLDFSGSMPDQLKQIKVAGLFPVTEKEIFFPAPLDCIYKQATHDPHSPAPTDSVAQKNRDRILKSSRIELKPEDGADFPPLTEGRSPSPFSLSKEQADEDFKPGKVPGWWPLTKMTDWLCYRENDNQFDNEWFDGSFLNHPVSETRVGVKINESTGIADDGMIFTTQALNLNFLPKWHPDKGPNRFISERMTEISLTARVECLPEQSAKFNPGQLNAIQTLGGEQRLVQLRANSDFQRYWKCPEKIRELFASNTVNKIRLVLATPAIFQKGWLPDQLLARLNESGLKLQLAGCNLGRWKAVSGWSLAAPRGPKPIRRMVPAGSVYYFEVIGGDPSILADQFWLKPVSDDPQECRDGFGLSLWGVW